MAHTVIMPKSGMAMEEGVIVQWLKNEGDVVDKGDPIVEIETDKATMEVEADNAGTLLRIVHGNGETVPVTATIGWIGELGENLPDNGAVGAAAPVAGSAGEDVTDSGAGNAVAADTSAAAGVTAPAHTGDRVRATPAARLTALETGVDIRTVAPGGSAGEVRAADVLAAQVGTRSVQATPLARKLAEIDGVDLGSVVGSGPGGRIQSRDLVSSVRSASFASADSPGEGSQPVRQALTRIERVTGARTLASHLEIPPVTVNADADVTDLMDLRRQINDRDGLHVTVNDMILKILCVVLQRHPRLNASLDANAGEVLLYPHIHLGVAVATDRGLLVPVLRHADRMSLAQISREMVAIRQRAADNALDASEISGSTFSVSNVGKYGITSFTPIINQPEAAILGVCGISDLLVRTTTGIEDRKVMGISLTFDHRIMDGVDSAEFVRDLVGALEKPLAALI